MILVSAIYNNNVTSVIGGRGRGLPFYLPSLINISNLGHPLVMYCEPDEVEHFKTVLSPYFKQLWVFGYKLESFKYFDRYIEWKQTFYQNIINDRNEVLCFSKMYWLKQTIEKNLTNDDMYMWIDSGLFHHGIFPEKVGGVELLVNYPTSKYYPENPNNIFNPRLGANLVKVVPKDKLFYCSLPAVGDQTSLRTVTESIYNKQVSILDHLIAGYFGGYKDNILNNFPHYESVLEKIIEFKIHCFEEHVFNCLYATIPEQYHLEKFDLWHFYSPGERTSYLEREANSFYKIFTRIHEQ